MKFRDRFYMRLFDLESWLLRREFPRGHWSHQGTRPWRWVRRPIVSRLTRRIERRGGLL